MKSVLVVGDVMFDRYVHVGTTRKAPEADIPVWDEFSREIRPGGAANVALNISALNPELSVYLCGVFDTDLEQGRWFWDKGISVKFSVPSIKGNMVKTRYIRDGEIIFRSDNFRKFWGYDVKSIPRVFSENAMLPSAFDAIVVSDYNKGTVTSEVLDVVKTRSLTDTLFVVDSKREDLEVFRGFDILKLNLQEYSSQVRHRDDLDCIESLFKHVIVTKGRDGAELIQYESLPGKKYALHSEDFPVVPAQVRDVTGCGDTHTAALVCSLLNEKDIRSSIKFANECARSVVQKFGTSIPDFSED